MAVNEENAAGGRVAGKSVAHIPLDGIQLAVEVAEVAREGDEVEIRGEQQKDER